MGDFRFLSDAGNLARAAAVTATSEDPVYGAANLTALPVSLPYRATGLSGQALAIDLGAAAEADLVALVGHNLTADATIQPGCGATAAAAATPQAGVSLAVGLRRVAHLLLAAPETHRYWSLAISDAGNPAGYLSFGYLVIGTTTELAGISHGWERQRVKSVRINRNELGVPIEGAAISDGTRLVCSFSGLSRQEADSIDAFLDGLDVGRVPALVLSEGADTSEPLFARLEVPHTRIREAGFEAVEGVTFLTDHLGQSIA